MTQIVTLQPAGALCCRCWSAGDMNLLEAVEIWLWIFQKDSFKPKKTACLLFSWVSECVTRRRGGQRVVLQLFLLQPQAEAHPVLCLLRPLTRSCQLQRQRAEHRGLQQRRGGESLHELLPPNPGMSVPAVVACFSQHADCWRVHLQCHASSGNTRYGLRNLAEDSHS